MVFFFNKLIFIFIFDEYILLLFYFIICFFLVLFLLLSSIFLVKQNPLSEKLSSYECGFNPFEDARTKFEIRFFLIGLFFIIFDLESAFLLPLATIINQNLSFIGFLFFIFFIIIFIFSSSIEWNQGALD